MNKAAISICILLNLFTIHFLFGDKRVSTIIIPRSPSVNAARELAGWEYLINISTAEKKNFAVCAINPEVTLSFRPERIAQCLFGDAIVSCNNTFKISGSRTSDRTRYDWLADYFGLPPDYKSCVTIEPRISQALINFDYFVGFDQWVPGLYLRAHAPLVYSRWNLDLCETLITTGSQVYDPGYFNAQGITRTHMSENFLSFISGIDAPNASGITFDNLSHAKMNCKSERLIKLSEIQIALGWNVLHCPSYHLGWNIRASIPTGNTPTGEYLFESIIGNGHHWEIGGGLSTHIMVWQNPDTKEQANIFFDGNITHLFRTRQCRSFDLCNNGFNSRYMLAQKMTPEIEHSLRGIIENQPIIPNAQYKERITTVANLTTIPVWVGSSVQADLALLISYKKDKNSWGLGYNFWARNCETIEFCAKTPFDISQWALKGDASLFGFETNVINIPIALSATQSKATINSGTNFDANGATEIIQVTNGKKNNNIDNPFPASADSDNDSMLSPLFTEPLGTMRINTSIQPVLLTTDDIDLESAQTQGRSHKIFSHFTHYIETELHPFLSIGGEIEFGQDASCPRLTIIKKPPCVNTALSYWGVWIKGGICF